MGSSQIFTPAFEKKIPIYCKNHMKFEEFVQKMKVDLLKTELRPYSTDVKFRNLFIELTYSGSDPSHASRQQRVDDKGNRFLLS